MTPLVRHLALVGALLGGVVLADGPQSIPDPAVVARSFPQAATSADGFVKVIAAVVPGDEMGFRDPILSFVGNFGDALRKGLNLPTLPRRSRPGLVIMAQDGRTNDARVVSHKTFLPRLGITETRVWLPSPGYSDFARLRFEIARAYLRGYVDSYLELPRSQGAPPPADIPNWVVAGAIAQSNIEVARADMREVLDGWSDGQFPFFPVLTAWREIPPVLDGFLVGWMKEKKLFGGYFEDLAKGRGWDGARLATALTGETDPVRQDMVSDSRFLRLMRKVISPGSSGEVDLRFFASHLLLYSPFYDKMFGNGHSYCTFREAAERFSEDPEVRRVAGRKAREVPLLALGRGEELQQAAFAYMEFLNALARGEEPGRLTLRLDEADLKLEAARVAARKGKSDR